jgi:glycosyltransferase involved in cell wall biosynthesis
MRILILTPQLPYPPWQGTIIRNFNLIAHLAARHEVHLLTFVRHKGQLAEAAPLCQHCASIHTVVAPRRQMSARLHDQLLTPHPDMALRLRSLDFQRALGEIVSRHAFDVIQVEGIELAQYALWLRGHPSPGLPPLPSPLPPGRPPLLVFDDHNAEYVLQQRAFETDLRRPDRWIGAAYSFVQWLRLRRYEARVCAAADRVVAVSSTDRNALRALVPGLDVTVVPNGVDMAYYTGYQPDPAALPGLGDHAPSALRQSSGPKADLVYVGKMDFRPNVDAMLWFANDILPRIHQEAPEARLYVVGLTPHRRLQRLARRRGIVITGGVPDVRNYVAPATIVVVPLRMGGGTRLKMLEAMAMGKAIVSTGVGAEGLDATPGRELIVANAPAKFAHAVVALLRDPARRAVLGQTAREFVAARFDWGAIVPRLETVYDGEASAGHG